MTMALLPKRPPHVLAIAAAVLAVAVAGCSSRETIQEDSGVLQVVAAENFWGSVAAQLGGNRVVVHSIVVNPDTDPHSYEPTAADARAMAASEMTIVNGTGYDEWASRLLAANPDGSRVVLNVGNLLGYRTGQNPHQWYSPAHVHRVIAQIVLDYQRLRPADAAYFAARRRALETDGLARYQALIAQVRARYQGVPVGYSESIFQPLGEALGLRLITPYSFAKAVAEGGEVSAQDKLTVQRQLSRREAKVWVLNSQNLTPEVQRAGEAARSAGLPVVSITETLSPATASFQQWQVSQLQALREALHAATGR
ncbi:MAG TPA: zinc ABC transporter substrate-binding protein [Solirubrobacteraceae bacterium]|nr:zinc ABC transporter substrate-binding protein [Solirubrobacteraceae bacterium]